MACVCRDAWRRHAQRQRDTEQWSRQSWRSPSAGPVLCPPFPPFIGRLSNGASLHSGSGASAYHRIVAVAALDGAERVFKGGQADGGDVFAKERVHGRLAVRAGLALVRNLRRWMKSEVFTRGRSEGQERAGCCGGERGGRSGSRQRRSAAFRCRCAPRRIPASALTLVRSAETHGTERRESGKKEKTERQKVRKGCEFFFPFSSSLSALCLWKSLYSADTRRTRAVESPWDAIER